MDPLATPPPIELRQLRYVVAVGEELNFTRAARRLHIAQQALSVAIRQLETQLGVVLFERSSRQVELTPAGRVLCAHAREVLDAAARAVEATVGEQGRLTGTLSIGCSYDAQHAVAGAFRRFRERWPEVELMVSLASDPALTDDLRVGRLDGMVAWDLAEEQADLSSTAVSEEEVLAVLPTGHPLAALGVIPRQALTGERIVMFERPLAPGVFDRLVSQVSRAQASPDVTLTDAQIFVSGQEAMVESTRQGKGVTLITRRLYARLQRPGVVARPIDPPMHAGIVLAWVHPPKPALRALVALLGDD